MNKHHSMKSKNQKTDNSISRRQFIGKVMLASASAALISSCKTEHYQIGCFTRPWAEYDYRVAFDGIAEAGFKLAALMTAKGGLVITTETTPEEAAVIGEEAKSRGLQIACMYGGNHDVSKSIDEGITQLKRLIDNSFSCGSSNLMIGGIGIPGLVGAYYKVIAECCDYAADRGVGLALKQHGGTNTTGAECRQHIEKVGHKNFNLLFDPGNVYYYTEGKLDPVDDADDVDGIVVGMCVKDFRMPNNVNVTPGTGMVDFPAVMSRLRQGGFTEGPLLVETFCNSGDLSYVNAEAKKSHQFLEELTR